LVVASLLICNVAPLKREGFLHHDATTKTNILNQQFASVFTEEDMDNLPDLGISPTPEMNKITINTEGVQNLLTVPWGTPEVTLHCAESLPSRTTSWERKSAIHPRQSITSHSRVVEFQEKTSVGNFIEGL
jgi:hypothetical protein